MSEAGRGEKARLPVGDSVFSPADVALPERKSYRGQYITLSPVVAESDATQLYHCAYGDPDKEQLWTYTRHGPFEDTEAMAVWLGQCESSTDPLFFTVTDQASGLRVGMVSFMNIVSEARRLEIGNIWYAPSVQRTKVNTECAYLMLCEAFDRLRYRRVEWKCDSLNAKSRAAATRLGFQFEGIFRQHFIVKGRNRDTAWFSMLDKEWPAFKANMERWLYHNADGALSLAQLNGAIVPPKEVPG